MNQDDNEKEYLLPSEWSEFDKYHTLHLSRNNLRVTCRGPGRNDKDTGSIRSDHPIPVSCSFYYYEVKIINKGRDGFIGIGLSKSDVSLNRMPGWDPNSYGYHGDDGHSFCCSGVGQNYGPKFTTGDIVGCCFNLIDRSCFFTKNGQFLGIAFRNLPQCSLYPTVGMQTPLECVEVNFGDSPFVFDIQKYIQEWAMRVRLSNIMHSSYKFVLPLFST